MHKDNRTILQIAVPSIVSNITVPLLGLVDLTIVGHIGNAAYISAIAVGSMIFNVIYWIFGFLRMGTSGLTAQAYGRRSRTMVYGALRKSVGTAIVIGLTFILLQSLILRLMLWLMNTPEESVPFVTQYFNIVIWGAPAMLSLYAMNGWFVGMQDTKITMVVAITQNIANIVASLFLVIILRWGIEGVATGTLFAQWFGALLAVCGVLLKRKSTERLWKRRTENLSSVDSKDTDMSQSDAINGDTEENISLKRFFTVNRDIFLRTLFLVAVNLFFTSAGGHQGALVLAVNSVVITLYTVFSYFMDGFAYAGEALCGKYYGNGNKEGFLNIVRCLNHWGIAMAVTFTIIYIIGGREFMGLLTSDAAVVEASLHYLPWACAIPLCGVTAFIYDGIFVGITATKGMLLSSATAAIVFFVVFFSLNGSIGNNALWLAFISFLSCRGLVEVIILRHKVMAGS